MAEGRWHAIERWRIEALGLRGRRWRCPLLLWHDTIGRHRLGLPASSSATSTGWTPWVLMGLGLACFVPDRCVEELRDPERRFYGSPQDGLVRLGRRRCTCSASGLATQVAQHRRRRLTGVASRLRARVSRFSEPQDARFRALNTLAGLRPAAVAARRRPVARARADARGAGDHLRGRPRRAARRASTPSSASWPTARFPFAADDEDIHMADRAAADRDRRPGRRAGCTPRARATTRWPPTSRCSRATPRARAAEALDGAVRARWSTPPSATSTGRCPATRTCSAPSPSTCRTTCSPTSGCCCATASASRFVERADRGAAARRRRAGRARTSTPTAALVAAELGFERGRARTRSTRSPTATSCSTTSAPPRPARRTCRRLGAEIVLWSSEEFGFVTLLRRVDERLVDHAAEEEPRRRRAAARQGAADRRRTSPRCTACCTRCR